jgi:hypothetical protein
MACSTGSTTAVEVVVMAELSRFLGARVVVLADTVSVLSDEHASSAAASTAAAKNLTPIAPTHTPPSDQIGAPSAMTVFAVNETATRYDAPAVRTSAKSPV